MTGRVSPRSLRVAVAVAVLYAVTAALLAATVAVHPSSRLLGDTTSDGAGVARGLWVAEQEHSTPFTTSRDRYEGAPEGVPQAPAINLVEPLQPAGVWSLSSIVGRIGAINLFLLLAVVASAVSVFLLAAHVLRVGLLAGVVAGYAAAFNPWMVEQALTGHLAFLFIVPLVALIGALAFVDERRSASSAALVGIAYGASFLTAAYVGMIATAIVVAGAGVIFVRTKGVADRLWLASLSSVALIVTFVTLVPGLVGYALHHAATARIAGHSATGGEALGVWPQQYLNPAPYLRILGSLHDGGRSLAFGAAESVVFFGYVTLALALAAVWLRRRGSLSLSTPTASAAFRICVAAAVVALLLSMPPHLVVGGVRVPLPSAALGAVTTYYRIYARFGLVVALAGALLAAFVIDAAWRRDRRLGGVLALLVVLELLPSALPSFSLAARPIDRWLRAHPAGIVAPYPQPTDAEAASRFALENQALQPTNGDPLYTLLSGGTGGTREAAIRILSRYVDGQDTPGILAAEHVKYVLVDDSVYIAEGSTPPSLSPAAFTQVATVGSTRIFAVSPSVAPSDLSSLLEQNAASIALVEGLPAPTVSYSGFAAPTADGWRTFGDGAMLTLRNADSGLRRAQLYVDLRTVGGGKASVTLTDGSGSTVGGSAVASAPTRMALGPLQIGTGSTSYTIHVAPAGARLQLKVAIVQALADFSVSLASG